MEKVVEVQQAVKQNAGEVQDYLRDLDVWSKKMEAKDEQLRQAKKKANASGDSSKANPPREASPPKKPKTEQKTPPLVQQQWSSAGPGASQKIKSYDYAAWDKFDVEAACEEVEKEVPAGSDASEEDDMEEERSKVEAVAEKERGNAAFKAGNWDKAIERYTRGMQLDPTNCVLPANRAMALLKKAEYGAAETDCTLALSIDPTYVKAYQRRASARTGLRRLGEAVTDYDEVLRLEPDNRAARAERIKLVDRVKEGLAAPGGEKPHRPPKEFEENLKGAMKGLGGGALETLKRDRNTMREITTKSRDLTTKMKNAEEKHNDKEKKVKVVKLGDENLVEPIQKATHLRSTKPMKRINVVDVASAGDMVEVMDTTENKVKTEEESEPVKPKAVTQSTGFCKKMENEISCDLSKVELVDSVPEVPKASSRFLADWRKLKTVVNRSKYLRQFHEADYKAVFKSSLDGGLLGEVVAAVHHLVTRGDVPEVVLRQVRGLAGLPRVGAVALFMSDQDKARLGSVLEELRCIAGPGEREAWGKVFGL